MGTVYRYGKEATHNTHFTCDGKADVSYSICALRNLPYAGLVRVEVVALGICI